MAARNPSFFGMSGWLNSFGSQLQSISNNLGSTIGTGIESLGNIIAGGPTTAATATSPANSQQQKNPVNAKRVFGAPLDKNAEEIPVVIEKTLAYLDREEVLNLEGLFRLSGDHKDMMAIKNMFDEGIDVDLAACTHDPHTVTNILKLYIRELPEPLLTFDLYDLFIASQSVNDKEAKYVMMKKVISCLPKGYKLIVAKLLRFMNKVAQHKDHNKMEPKNLAIVFGPNLLRHESEDVGCMITDSPHSNALVATLIGDCDVFFPPETN